MIKDAWVKGTRFSRRSIGGWCTALVLLAGCTAPAAQRHEYVEALMGTTFRLVFYAPDPGQAEAAAQRVWKRLHALDAICSDYRPDSELSLLSRRSDQENPTPWVPLSSDLHHILLAAQRLAAATDGAFDVTVGPLVRLWRQSRRQGKLPREDRVAAARTSVGHGLLEVDPVKPRARLLGPAMRIDLGGIAKGHALDAALQVLQAAGITRALVDGGGDIAVHDPPPGQAWWTIGVPVSRSDEALQQLRLVHAAVATSGDTFQYVEIDGVRYSHIIDPRTGRGLTTEPLSVIIAKDGITADSVASALCVLGPLEGIAFAEARPDLEARLMSRDGDLCVTRETSGYQTFTRGDPR